MARGGLIEWYPDPDDPTTMRGYVNRNNILEPIGATRPARPEELRDQTDELNARLGGDVEMRNPRLRSRSDAEIPDNNPRGKNLRLFDNSPQNTQDSQGTLPSLPNMSQSEDVNMEMAMARSGPGGGASGVSKETPITIATPSYGLQETHTTILPFNFWFSAVGPTYDGDMKLRIRTNSIDDILVTQLASLAAGGVWQAKTLYNVPFNNADSRSQATAQAEPATFPRTIATGANTTERPFWAQYWKDYYEYYTVLGCEYKITVRNVQTTANGSNMLIAIDHDSYSDTQGASGNITPDATLAEFYNFRHVKWENVGGQVNTMPNKNIAVIQGTIRPGQTHRNISNDGDVKTWTKTDGSTPTLKEIMNIRFFRDPLNSQFVPGSTPVMGSQPAANVEVRLKYIVQFKDLKEAARYPYTTNAATIPASATTIFPSRVLDTVGA